MKMYNGYNPQLSAGTRKILPAGGYVARILNAATEQTQYGDRLVIEFDIAEGEYTGFFQADYKNQQPTQDRGKKWRGVYRAYWPTGDGSEKDGSRITTMNNVVAAIEISNHGFQWNKNGNLDERELKGKIVGVLFRDKEWEWNGRTGWTTECCRLTDSEIIRSGDFQIPAKRPLQRDEDSGFGGSYQDAGAPAYSDFDAPPARGWQDTGNEPLPWN